MTTANPIASWRNHGQNYRLEGVSCTQCSKTFFPKKYLCPCGSTAFLTTKLSRTGILLSYTEVINPPAAFSGTAPYCLGIIELQKEVKLISQLTEATIDQLEIGMMMQAVFRKLYEDGKDGIIHYGIKFRPVEQELMK